MLLPNFLIIGAQKSGTTALHAYLGQHPQIYMSPQKETNFFSWGLGGLPNYRRMSDVVHSAISCWEDYYAQFAGATSELAIGESSHTYLDTPEVPARIKQYLPQIKLIAILRQPVDRAYSAYLHWIRDHREPLRTFEQALAAEQQRRQDSWGSDWYYLQRGLYVASVKRYYDTFDKSQIKIFLYDDFVRQPQVLMREIFDFLQVDAAFMPDMHDKVNVSGYPRYAWLSWILQRPNLLHWPLKPFVRYRVRIRWIKRLRQYNWLRPPMRPDTRQRLTDFFRPDVLQLQDLLQRDLSDWLAVDDQAPMLNG